VDLRSGEWHPPSNNLSNFWLLRRFCARLDSFADIFIKLPKIMRWLSRYQGAITHSRLDRAVVARYFAFLIISQLVVFSLLGVGFQLVTQIVNNVQSGKSVWEIIKETKSQLSEPRCTHQITDPISKASPTRYRPPMFLRRHIGSPFSREFVSSNHICHLTACPDYEDFWPSLTWRNCSMSSGFGSRLGCLAELLVTFENGLNLHRLTTISTS
jgi:hypothetical protein